MQRYYKCAKLYTTFKEGQWYVYDNTAYTVCKCLTLLLFGVYIIFTNYVFIRYKEILSLFFLYVH